MKNSSFFGLFWIVPCLVMVCGSAQGLDNWLPVATEGVTAFHSAFGKKQVVVKMTSHEVEIGKPSDPRPEKVLSSCTYARFPCSLVDYLEISVNDKPLFVARSVYADLADVNKVNVQQQKGVFILTVDGGDASESYRVKVIFDEQSIRKRILMNNETGQVLQETIYAVQKTMDE